MTIIKAATYIRLVVHWASLFFAVTKRAFLQSVSHVTCYVH